MPDHRDIVVEFPAEPLAGRWDKAQEEPYAIKARNSGQTPAMALKMLGKSWARSPNSQKSLKPYLWALKGDNSPH